MTENLNQTNEHDAPQTGLHVGGVLRAEREARGLSVEEIADRVKYSVRQVEALEQNDAEHLPQGTFLRGFIRSYARVLGMDEAKLLEVTHTQTEHHFDVTDVQAGGAPLPITGEGSLRSRYLLLGALAVAILLAAFVWTQPKHLSLPTPSRMSEAPAIEPVSTVSSVPATEPAVIARKEEPAKVAEVHHPEPVTKKPEAAKPLPLEKPAPVAKSVPVEKPAPVVKPVESVKPVAKAADVQKPNAAPTPLQASVTPSSAAPMAETEPPLVPVKPTVPLAQLMKRPIHIVFNEDAWMEIIDVNGEILLSRVTKAGEEKWIGGGHRAPYSITIGKPGAIRMYYHGKEVDLSQYNTASVAKLVLE